MWCHEWFDLAEAPDIVTFSKKMLTGGLYHKPDLRPRQAWRVKHFIFIARYFITTFLLTDLQHLGGGSEQGETEIFYNYGEES